MGNLYSVVYNIYNDANFEDLAISNTGLYFGIPQCIENPVISETTVTSSTPPNFFVSYLNSLDELSLLGSPYLPGTNGYPTTRFHPLAQPYRTGSAGQYAEIVFANGAKVRSSFPLGSSAFGRYNTFYDKDGNVIAYSVDFSGIYSVPENNWNYGLGLSCTLIEEGALAGDLYSFYVSAAYRSGSWVQLLGSVRVGDEIALVLKTFFNGITPSYTDVVFHKGTKAEYLSGDKLEGEFYYITDTNELYLGSELLASGSQIPYRTTVPSYTNNSGLLEIAYLNTDPPTKYDGYLYMTKES